MYKRDGEKVALLYVI